MKKLVVLAMLSVSAIATLGGCVSAPARFTKPQSPQQFTPCSSAPHCVSSQSKPGSFHYVAPLAYTGSAEHAQRVLLQTLRESKNGAIKTNSAGFVYATFSSTLGFVDDVTFIAQPQRHVVDIKSNSRIGFSDLGVNGRRVERLRTRFEMLLRAS